MSESSSPNATLHEEVERQIGYFMKCPGNGAALALLNRCSQIIKGLEERVAITPSATSLASSSTSLAQDPGPSAICPRKTGGCEWPQCDCNQATFPEKREYEPLPVAPSATLQATVNQCRAAIYSCLQNEVANDIGTIKDYENRAVHRCLDAVDKLLGRPPSPITCAHGVLGYCETCALRDPGEFGECGPTLVSRDDIQREQ